MSLKKIMAEEAEVTGGGGRGGSSSSGRRIDLGKI